MKGWREISIGKRHIQVCKGRKKGAPNSACAKNLTRNGVMTKKHPQKNAVASSLVLYGASRGASASNVKKGSRNFYLKKKKWKLRSMHQLSQN